MDLEGVQSFVEVAQAGSLSAAAMKRGIPKSTFSRRLARLEKELGSSLLYRTPRGVRLTDEGEEFFAKCAPALAALTAAAGEMIADSQTPKGVVRITAPQDFAVALLPGALATFATAFPEVQVEAEMTNRLVDVVEERFDLAIRAGALGDSAMMTRRPMRVQRWLAASPAFVQKHEIRRPSDLERLPCAIFGRSLDGAVWRLTHPFKRPVSVRVTGPVAARDFTLLYHMAAAGEIVALLPHFLVLGAEHTGTLKRVLAPWFTAAGSLNLVHPMRNPPLRVRLLRDHLYERFSLRDPGRTS